MPTTYAITYEDGLSEPGIKRTYRISAYRWLQGKAGHWLVSHTPYRGRLFMWGAGMMISSHGSLDDKTPIRVEKVPSLRERRVKNS